jgi:uncharacterized protein YegJ (DUF2314 family)
MKVQLVLFILLAFSLLTGCDNARAGIIDVDKDDDEMNSAMAEARQTIDEFWSARDLGGAEFGGLLKVYFFDPDGDPDDGEHMWVRVSRRTGPEIQGTLLSNPMSLTSVAQGDSVRFQLDRVSDWLVASNGMARGAYTVQLLRKRMTDSERREHDSAYPFRFECSDGTGDQRST